MEFVLTGSKICQRTERGAVSGGRIFEGFGFGAAYGGGVVEGRRGGPLHPESVADGLAQGDTFGQQEVAAIAQVEGHEFGAVVAGFAAVVQIHELQIEASGQLPAGGLTEAKQVAGEGGFEQFGAEAKVGVVDPAAVVVGVEGQVIVYAVVAPVVGVVEPEVFAAHFGGVQGVFAVVEAQGLGRAEPPAFEGLGPCAHAPEHSPPTRHPVLHQGRPMPAAASGLVVVKNILIEPDGFDHATPKTGDLARAQGDAGEAEREDAEGVHGANF